MTGSNTSPVMNEPSAWELFQNVMIGTVAGVMASGIMTRSILGVSILAVIFWFVLVLGLKVTRPIFAWIDDEEEDSGYRPYKDVNYAS